MKLLNSKFNIDDVIKITPDAEVWYKLNFPQNVHMFPVIEKICREKFVIYDVAKFQRSGEIHLYAQKVSELSVNLNAECVIFILDRNGCCADSKLCWFNFNESLFIKDRL